jgi:hypothetical protein
MRVDKHHVRFCKYKDYGKQILSEILILKWDKLSFIVGVCYETKRKEYKENIITQSINRNQAYAHAKFSVSKIHARKS